MAFVVSAIGAAWVAGAAIVGGAAVTAAAVATIAAGVAAAGTVLTVVGRVTKSKELMKIGKVMSIAGGITALGAGLVSSMASAGTSAASAGATNVVPGAVADAAGGAASDAMANQAVDTLGSSVADNLASASQNALPGLGEASSSLMSSAPEVALSSIPQASVAPVAGQVGMSTAPVDLGASAIGNIQNASMAAAPGAAPGMLQGVKDWWGTLSAPEKAKITDNVMQMGGKAVGGIFEGWSADKKLEIEEEIRREQQKRYDTGQKNGNFVPTIGFQPRLNGLINSGPKGG